MTPGIYSLSLRITHPTISFTILFTRKNQMHMLGENKKRDDIEDNYTKQYLKSGI